MKFMSIEVLREIYYSVRQNKMRTVLSGFGVSWGILILVVLLGTGKGFQDAVMGMFNVFAQKTMYIYGNSTSQKYKNVKEGKTVRFDEAYLQSLKNRFPEIVAISPQTSSWQLVQNGMKSGLFNIIGVNTDYMQIRILSVKEDGRPFTPGDMERKRDVAIIGGNVASALFGSREALHKHIQVRGVYFRVIGVLKNDDIFSSSEINSVYIPFPSYRRAIDTALEFPTFFLYPDQATDSKQFESELRHYIAYKSGFSSQDNRAVYVANLETQTSAFESLFKGIRMFIWAVGICFLISGVVGISNIMFVTVKERTNEIGIRLAVGASPRSIISLILLESVVVTTAAGMVGLLAGKGILLFIDRLLSMSGSTMLMQKTTLDIATALMSLFVLVIAGVIAGVFPAIKASTIEPVDAIQYENRK
ncbi:MAG: ABC transporter permease [Tannerella sp.]|jgi:putative ABC transport system permease protein|nr:ABC transporter permease [Tannerella sp.]